MRDGYILRTFADELQTPSLAIVWPSRSDPKPGCVRSVRAV